MRRKYYRNRRQMLHRTKIALLRHDIRNWIRRSCERYWPPLLRERRDLRDRECRSPRRRRLLPWRRISRRHLIPESAAMKKGKLAIEFAITKDGQVAGMKLVASSGDVALDRAAWGGITGSNPFPPLPTDFGGQYLSLRFRFYYNPDKADLE